MVLPILPLPGLSQTVWGMDLLGKMGTSQPGAGLGLQGWKCLQQGMRTASQVAGLKC